MRYYREVSVWKRLNDTSAVRYRCFEDLERRLFTVQSADRYHLPINDEMFRQHARQAIELQLEEDPFDRAGVFGSLIEAIEHHERMFEDRDS
jgi:hypothetical protein